MSRASVALVLVSHSAKVAEGVVDIAGVMAPNVLMRAAGGIGDGRIGTSYERVEAAVCEALEVDGVEGVVLLTDLGSATLTAESVLDILEDERVALAEGPFVEGAVAAGVAAQLGGDLAAVRAAVVGAGALFALASADGSGEATPPPVSVASAPVHSVPGASGPGERESALTRTLTLRNKVGLHARPAAMLARLVAGHDAVVTVNGVDAASVLSLMALGLAAGDQVHLAAHGQGAARALEEIEALVADGFGEE